MDSGIKKVLLGLAGAAALAAALVVFRPGPRRQANRPGPAPAPGNAAATASRSPSAPAVAGSTCGCPTLPVVATSKDPAKGSAYRELSEADLEAIFSNRDALYGDSWEKGLHKLSHDIDPTGALKIYDGQPDPPSTDETGVIPLHEGELSSLLIEGRPRRPEASGSPWGRPHDSPLRMSALLSTLARINKYGEPESRLRDHVLRAARYLTDDLANVPSDAPIGGRGQLVRHEAFEARRVVIQMIERISPYDLQIDTDATAEGERLRRVSGVKKMRGAVESFNGPDRPGAAVLTLDAFDMANAALDVLLSTDEKGVASGIFTPRREDARDWTNTLVDVASGRKIFGGKAVPDSVQDVIACRAFQTVIALADAKVEGAEKLRRQLLDIWAGVGGGHALGSSPEALAAAAPFGLPNEAAASSAIVLSGVASTAEAEELVRATMQTTLAGPEDLRGARVGTVKAIESQLGGPDRPTYQDVVTALYTEKFRILQERIKAGTSGPSERQSFDLWNAGAVAAGTSADATSGKGGKSGGALNAPVPGTLCAPAGCDPFSDKPLVARADYQDQPHLIVYSAVQRRPDGRLADDETVGTLSRDEPFFVELTVSAKRAASMSQAPTVRLGALTTGKSAVLTLDKRLKLSAGPVVFMNTLPVTIGDAGPLGPTADETLRKLIEQKLFEKSIRGITVTVQNGVVTLHGTVSGAAVKSAAVKVVRDLGEDKYKYLLNEIVVAGTQAESSPPPAASGPPSPYPLGPPLSLKTANGDTVTVVFALGVWTDFEVYDDGVQQTIAKNDKSFAAIKVLFEGLLEDLKPGALPQASPGSPPETAEQSAARQVKNAAKSSVLEKKLQLIENARLIIHNKPSPKYRVAYSELTRAEVGTSYLSFLNSDPRNWDQTPGSCRGDQSKGPALWFPGVNYLSCEENGIVQLAIDSAKEKMDQIIFGHLVHLSIGAYRIYMIAACAEMTMAGAPLCPEDFWTIVEGVDPVSGERVSVTGRVLRGAGIAAPAVLARVTPRLRAFMSRQFSPAREAVAAKGGAGAAQIAREEAMLARRSEEVSAAISAGEASEVRSVQAEIDYEKVNLPIHETPPLKGAKLVTPASFDAAKLGAAGQSLAPGGFPLQVGDNTCLLAVAEWFRRKVGLKPRSEAANVLRAMERSPLWEEGRQAGKLIYDPKTGGQIGGFMAFMEVEGASVARPREANLVDIERELIEGKQVMARIKVESSAGKFDWHAVSVEEIIHHRDAGHTVRIGDPSSGNFWDVDACTFRGALDPTNVVFVGWK